MNGKKETPPDRPRRAPEWVSPWSFQAEWQDEVLDDAAPERLVKEPVPARVTAKQGAPTEITGRPQERRVEPVAALRQASNARPAASRGMPATLPDAVEFETTSAPTAPDAAGHATTRRAAPRPAARHRPPAPPSMALRALGVLFRLACLLLGVAGLLMLAQIYLQDVPRPVDDDLRVRLPPDIAPKSGAPGLLRTFLDAVISVERQDLKNLPPWRWDPVTTQQVVSANGAALDSLRDLLADYDWHPNHSAWHREDLGAHPAWAAAAVLLQARVALLMGMDDQAAFRAALDIGRLARQLQALRSWPSFMRRGQELHLLCLQSTARVLRGTRLDSAALRAVQDALAAVEPLDHDLQEGLSAFYLHEKKRLLGALSGEPLDTMPGGVLAPRAGRLFFKTHETLACFAQAFRDMRDEIAAPVALGKGARALPRLAALSGLRPNGAGERYFLERWQDYQSMSATHRLARARQMLVHVMCALRRHAADHRQPPSGLSELRPDYLSQEPLDPFSGRPLEYDPLRDVLYSVGVNGLREDGHVTDPPMADPDEPTVRLGFLPDER